jgi:hypothetical protein
LVFGAWLVAAVVGGGAAQAAPVYFLIAEPPGSEKHFDSFVVGLEDPLHVAHARDLIARGPLVAGDPILVADIVAGADGINRDHRAPGAPLWSWHVTAVDGFAAATIELIDGWPTGVENDVAGWIANTGGKIGFWSYTVVEELAVPEPGAFGLAAMGMLAMCADSRLRRRVCAHCPRWPSTWGRSFAHCVPSGTRRSLAAAHPPQ